MQQLGAQLKRLGCGYRDCGSHGLIFSPKNTGGLKIEGGELHFWGCCANTKLHIEDASEILSELPDEVGHRALCASLRGPDGIPDNPECPYLEPDGHTGPAESRQQ